METHLAAHGRRRPQAPLHPGRPLRVVPPPRPRRHLTSLRPPCHGRKKLAAPPPPDLRRRHRRHHPLLVAGQEGQLLPRLRHPRPHHPPPRPSRLRPHQTQQKARRHSQIRVEEVNIFKLFRNPYKTLPTLTNLYRTPRCPVLKSSYCAGINSLRIEEHPHEP